MQLIQTNDTNPDIPWGAPEVHQALQDNSEAILKELSDYLTAETADTRQESLDAIVAFVSQIMDDREGWYSDGNRFQPDWGDVDSVYDSIRDDQLLASGGLS